MATNRSTRRDAEVTGDDHIDVDLALAEYNDTFLECRDLMHAWRIFGYYRAGSGGGWGGTNRLLKCARCGMERTDRWDGITVRHSYNQPEGYRIEGVRLSKGDVRAEQLRRARQIFDSEEAMKKALKRRKGGADVRSIHTAGALHKAVRSA